MKGDAKETKAFVVTHCSRGEGSNEGLIRKENVEGGKSTKERKRTKRDGNFRARGKKYAGRNSSATGSRVVLRFSHL